MASRPPIQAVIETQGELDTTRRNWRMVLFNEDGTPFLSEDGVLGPTTLAALTDVDLSGLADAYVLSWDDAANTWVAIPAPTGGGGGGETVEAWQAPTTIEAEWATSGTSPLEYRKDSLGKVALRGSAVVVTAFSWGGTVFTLPPGYRPTQKVEVFLPYQETFGGGMRFGIWAEINTDGTVKVITQAAGGTVNGAAGSHLDFDTVEFYTDDEMVIAGGPSLADIQDALDDGTLVLPAGGWRAFKNIGAAQQSFWNGWSQVADTPVLFRQNGNQVEFIGHATGGTAAPGNAIVQMPDSLQPAVASQDFSGDLRVAVISGHTYIVMIAGSLSDYDFSSISYTLA